jgi:hypothetical protein
VGAATEVARESEVASGPGATGPKTTSAATEVARESEVASGPGAGRQTTASNIVKEAVAAAATREVGSRPATRDEIQNNALARTALQEGAKRTNSNKLEGGSNEKQESNNDSIRNASGNESNVVSNLGVIIRQNPQSRTRRLIEREFGRNKTTQETIKYRVGFGLLMNKLLTQNK